MEKGEIEMLVSGKTDIGRRREINQDNIFISTEAVGNLPNLFIVADGMGGHKAGDYASRYAVETIVSSIKSGISQDVQSLITKAILDANSNIVVKSATIDDYNGMGTTLVLTTIIDNKLITANIGDSRLYVIRGKKLEQITEDHSLVAEMLRQGQITADEAKEHPDRNIITRAVGTSDYVIADFFEYELDEETYIMLCSDGLSNMLDEKEIVSIITNDDNLDVKTDNLIDRANANGGNDNISVILIKV